MLSKQQPRETESYREDQPGQSTDKLIPHQEDFTWPNSAIHMVKLVTTQETSYQLVQLNKHTRIMSSLSELHRLLIIHQVTMVSYPTSTWTKKLWPNRKVNQSETRSLNKTLLKIKVSDSQGIKVTNQQVSSTTEEPSDQLASQPKERNSIENRKY